MRDNGIPETQGLDGLDWFAGLAREAVGRLVSVRDEGGTEVNQAHLELFLKILASDSAVDPGVLLDTMMGLHLEPAMIACDYATEAARVLGEGWLSDELSFVDVTIRTERLHGLVRRVDEMVADTTVSKGPSALVLVAQAEQHTLGAFVLALQLRLAGFSAVVRVAPAAAELTLLLAANRFDVAVVSIGCTAGLESGVGLVRTLRLMSRGEMRIYAGGAVPVTDDVLLEKTGADRVLRHVSALLTEYKGQVSGRALDRDFKASQRSGARSALKGVSVEK